MFFLPKGRDFCFRRALFNENCANRTKKLSSENRFLTGVNLTLAFRTTELVVDIALKFYHGNGWKVGSKRWNIWYELQQRTAKGAKKWKEILERISATVQTLAQQNFFLRSHCELLLSIPIQKILWHV